MKKFTRNFLSGGRRSLLHVLRSVALGLVALLWAQGTAFAQCPAPDGPVSFSVSSYDDCFKSTDAVYSVMVSAAKFYNVDSINLFLDYNQADFVFDGFEILESTFNQTTHGNVPLSVDDNGDRLNIHWKENDTRGTLDNSGTSVPFLKLNFRASGTPGAYTNNLTWDTGASTVWYCGGSSEPPAPEPPYAQFGDDAGEVVNFFSGDITTSIAYTSISYTINPEVPTCANSSVDITVTNPVGSDIEYSFNGRSWTSNPVANSTPGNNTVQVRNRVTKCVSIIEPIVVNSPSPLAYELEVTDETCDRQGEIQFNITTEGTAPYTYWVIPTRLLSSVTNTIGNFGENDPSLAQYKSSSNQILRSAGWYSVAIQDANGCIDLANRRNWRGTVIRPGSTIDAEVDLPVSTVTCPGGNDGILEVEYISSGVPYSDGTYNVKVTKNNSVVDSRRVDPTGYVWYDLTPGSYEVEISDSLACGYRKTVTIKDVNPWTFYVEYTDAPCADATGTLWVSEVRDGAGNLLDKTTLSGVDFHVTGGTADNPVDATINIADTLKDIPAANYSAWIEDTNRGCARVAFVNKDGSGNVIPILDDGSITFTAVTTNETCFGVKDGSVKVTDVTRSCENCNEGAYYEYALAYGVTPAVTHVTGWLPISTVIDTLSPNDYWVIVRDSTKKELLCASYQKITISGADAPLALVIDSVYAPYCHDGNDGYVRMHVTGGTKPYRYSVDDRPNWRNNPPFGLTEGPHVFKVIDAQGCEVHAFDTIAPISPLEITASIKEISCPGQREKIDVQWVTTGRITDPYDHTYFYSTTEEGVRTGKAFIPSWDTTALATRFAAGTYYVGAKSPYGCRSNVVKVVLEPVERLTVDISSEPATCYGTWSGKLNIEVTGGHPDSTFYYAFANNPEPLAPQNDDIIDWRAFEAGSKMESVEVQKGIYYVIVKGSCGQYTRVFREVVDGYDKIRVNEITNVKPVTCYGGNDGKIVIEDSNVSGGAPGFGVPGAHYLYTLYNGNDEVVGSKMQQSAVYDGLSAGYYMLYVHDNTDPDADPAMCPPDSVQVFVPEYPELSIPLVVSKMVSCAGANDGEIQVHISGGLGGTSNLKGYDQATDPDGNAYTVTVNGITDPNKNYTLELPDLLDTVVFQTQGGDFEIIVADANGCEVRKTVTVYEPKPWAITEMITEPSDCGEKDGVIKGIISGGLDSLFYVDVTLNGADLGRYYTGDTVTFIDSAMYSTDYKVCLANSRPTRKLFGIVRIARRNGIRIVPNEYPERSETVGCTFCETYTIEVINPFDFTSEAECTKCHGESNGTIKIKNIEGGSGAYQFQFVNSLTGTYDANDESAWWPKKADGSNMWVTDSVEFNKMPAGEYKIYLRDSEGFTLAKCCRPKRIVVCETDSLELLNVNLVNGVNCVGDSTGAIVIEARGGVAPYMYAYTRTEIGDNSYPYQGLPDPSELTWYNSDTIRNLPVGTYIGWVMDANGCLTGCEINSEGLPIDDHRVVLMDEGSLAVDNVSVRSPRCYGGEATVVLTGVTSGVSTSQLIFMLEGENYKGEAVSRTFDPMAPGQASYSLPGVLAPKAGTSYTLSLKTDLECKTAGIKVDFEQPAVYAVDMSVIGDGICVGEQEAVILLTTTGGTAPFNYDIYADGVEYAMNSTNDKHVVPIGPKYHVVSTDALGCTASDTLDLPTPLDITFNVENVTCHADTLASAMVTAQGTPGRQFIAKWREFEGDKVISSGSSDKFDESIKLDQVFVYDDTNIKDVHYEITVVDDQGCTAGIDTITFDKVDVPLSIVNEKAVAGDCKTAFTFEITGGTAPYKVWVDGEVVAESITFLTPITVDLDPGMHTVQVTDMHECIASEEHEIDYAIKLDTMLRTYVGEATAYVNAAAGLDTTLKGGVHMFNYTNTGGCKVHLTVTVEERERTAPVLVTMTPQGTIEDNHPDFVMTFTEDLVFAETGNLVVTEEGASEPTLTLPITADLILGRAVTVTYNYETDGALKLNTNYIVTVGSGIFQGDGLTWAGISDNSWKFKTGERNATDVETIPAADFKVYPNPFTSSIKVENYDKLDRIVMTNIAGQRVLDIEEPNSEEIRTGNLVAGVYIVTLIRNNSIVKSERIIKR